MNAAPRRQVSMQFTNPVGDGRTLTISESSDSASCADFLQRACETMTSLLQPAVVSSSCTASATSGGTTTSVCSVAATASLGDRTVIDNDAAAEAGVDGNIGIGGTVAGVDQEVNDNTSSSCDESGLRIDCASASGRWPKRQRRTPERFSPEGSVDDDDSAASLSDGSASVGSCGSVSGSDSDEDDSDDEPTVSDLEFIASDGSASVHESAEGEEEDSSFEESDEDSE